VACKFHEFKHGAATKIDSVATQERTCRQASYHPIKKPLMYQKNRRKAYRSAKSCFMSKANSRQVIDTLENEVYQNNLSIRLKRTYWPALATSKFRQRHSIL